MGKPSALSRKKCVNTLNMSIYSNLQPARLSLLCVMVAFLEKASVPPFLAPELTGENSKMRDLFGIVEVCMKTFDHDWLKY